MQLEKKSDLQKREKKSNNRWKKREQRKSELRNHLEANNGIDYIYFKHILEKYVDLGSFPKSGTKKKFLVYSPDCGLVLISRISRLTPLSHSHAVWWEKCPSSWRAFSNRRRPPPTPKQYVFAASKLGNVRVKEMQYQIKFSINCFNDFYKNSFYLFQLPKT